jgi:hypothetical protein
MFKDNSGGARTQTMYILFRPRSTFCLPLMRKCRSCLGFRYRGIGIAAANKPGVGARRALPQLCSRTVRYRRRPGHFDLNGKPVSLVSVVPIISRRKTVPVDWKDFVDEFCTHYAHSITYGKVTASPTQDG